MKDIPDKRMVPTIMSGFLPIRSATNPEGISADNRPTAYMDMANETRVKETLKELA
jgi:hypothetical protein